MVVHRVAPSLNEFLYIGNLLWINKNRGYESPDFYYFVDLKDHHCCYKTETSSTSKISVALGGMTPPAPRSP